MYKYRDFRTSASAPGMRETCGNPDCILVVRVEENLRKGAGIVTWSKQSKEWEKIRDEFIDQWKAGSRAGPPSAYEITTEQKKRMEARGEKKMEYEDILDELRNNGGKPLE